MESKFEFYHMPDFLFISSKKQHKADVTMGLSLSSFDLYVSIELLLVVTLLVFILALELFTFPKNIQPNDMLGMCHVYKDIHMRLRLTD